jgi:hypothetical protein
VTTAGYATAPYWPWLNQICEPRRAGKAASVGRPPLLGAKDAPVRLGHGWFLRSPPHISS